MLQIIKAVWQHQSVLPSGESVYNVQYNDAIWRPRTTDSLNLKDKNSDRQNL